MVTIDFRQEAAALRALLVDGVRNYVSAQNPAVSRIDFAFSLGDSESIPWVMLQFDTKPGSEPDGDPTCGDGSQQLYEDRDIDGSENRANRHPNTIGAYIVQNSNGASLPFEQLIH